jgi:NADH-quinone oxidoreductase subunit I
MTRLYGTGILRSLILSFKQMMRGTITVQYPKQKIVLPERARWAVEIKPDEDGNHKCTGCRACEKACPDYVIRLDITTNEDRSKVIDLWHYELGACMMCGLCVEACPFSAIEMSHDYELARIDPDTLTIDLLTDVPAAVAKRRTPAAEPAAAEPAAAEAPAAPVTKAPSAAPEGGADV